MKKTLYVAYILVLVFFLGGCRSSRHLSEEILVDSLSQASYIVSVDSSLEEVRTEKQDSVEMLIWMITEEYDASKADTNGVAPLQKITKTFVIKRTHTKLNKEYAKKQTAFATTKTSAELKYVKSNKREATKANSKQPKLQTLRLFCVALVVLMVLLVYWVFTKYRA